MLQTFDSRMRRAVQQENRGIQAAISRGNSKTNKSVASWHRHGGMLVLIVSPVVIVLGIIACLKTYNSWTANIEDIPKMTQSVERELTQRHHRQRLDSNRKASIRTEKHDIVAQAQSLSFSSMQHNQQEALILATDYGHIRIVLRPDLSPESVEYIHNLVTSGVCTRCNFYRAEKPGILQGVMANPAIPINDKKGQCPEGLSESVHNDCPAWDMNCGCHGPIMTQGAVGWAGGQAGGPDFFINNYKDPARFWGTQHTNFGRIEDDESFKVINRIFDLPVRKQGMMSMIENRIHFDMSIKTDDNNAAGAIGR